MIAARWPWFEVDVLADRLVLSGELDLVAARKLDEVAGLLGALLPSSQATLDLAGVTFVDTAGLDGLVRLERQLAIEGVTLAPGPASPTVERLRVLLARVGGPPPGP